MAYNVWKCRNQQGRHIDRETVKILLNFQSNWTNLRFFMMHFTFKYSKNNDFLVYFLFKVAKTLFFAIFCVFRFVLNFHDFSMLYHRKWVVFCAHSNSKHFILLKPNKNWLYDSTDMSNLVQLITKNIKRNRTIPNVSDLYMNYIKSNNSVIIHIQI